MIKKIVEFPILIRHATLEDIPKIKQIANKYPKELGFVNRAALLESIKRHSLLVADYKSEVCVGFVNFYPRKDGWNTVHEIAVHPEYKRQLVGKRLIEAVPTPIRLKCTTDNPANHFYEQMYFKLIRTEQGRVRKLNVWEKERLLIVCYGSNRKISNIIHDLKLPYGTRHSEIPYQQPYFVDIRWTEYDWPEYLIKLRAWKPVFAMVPDFTDFSQRKFLYQAVKDLKKIGVLHIGVCPKFDGAVKYIPSFCRVCVSIPTSHAGFLPNVQELEGRTLHLLGGGPKKVKEYIETNPNLNIVSADSNYQFNAARWGKLYLAKENVYKEMGREDYSYYTTCKDSTVQINKMFLGLD